MKILLVQTGFLGDVILSTPVASVLAEQYPEAELSVLTTPVAAQVFQAHPAVKEVIVFNKRSTDAGFSGLWRMAKRLRAAQFDIVFSLHKSYRTALLLALARIPIRYGFSEASARRLYTKTAPRKDLPHEVQRNLAILRNIDLDPQKVSRPMLFRAQSEHDVRAEELLRSLEGKPLIGIAPGSVWATKRWTKEGFAAVARELSRQGYGVVLIGGPEDAESAKEIEESASEPLLNLVGKTSVAESAALVSRLGLLVTNDSAPLHFASATGTPVVAIFCATVPEFGFGPWMVPSRVLGVEGLACRPCGRHGGQTCPTGTHACQKNLGAEQVLAAVRSLSVETAARPKKQEAGAAGADTGMFEEIR